MYFKLWVHSEKAVELHCFLNPIHVLDAIYRANCHKYRPND
jgi:hypothetical protein